ncbi:HNH endonuclease signature motif containing protein [Arthrobacter alpinus]|nr:HNH endonuclease signature motif containing protein [Arthrobacter alpinus]
MHYQRWKKDNGHLLAQKRHWASVEERFWSKVDKTETCWNWIGGFNKSGYGRLKIDGKFIRAHIRSFEMENGEVPAGMVVDHRCHNEKCVRPVHLRLVTHKQNSEHRIGAQKNSKSGIRGVYWAPTRNAWIASVRHCGRQVNLGTFSTAADAERAAIAKRNELFTHNDHDRKEVK